MHNKPEAQKVGQHTPYIAVPNNDPVWTVSLPILSAIFVIATLPPFNIWVLGFFSIAPIYFFIKTNLHASWIRLSLGGFIFSFLFTAFLMSQTILQFHWIREAYLFSNIVKIAFIPLLILMSLFSSGTILVLRRILQIIEDKLSGTFPRSISTECISILFATLVWTFSEWVIRKSMFSIEYSVLGYPAHNTFFVSLAGMKIGGLTLGSVFLTIFFVALINTAIGSLCFYIYKRKFINCISPIGILILSFTFGYIVYTHNSQILLKEATDFKTIKIAIIQDQDRTKETFGKEKNGHFHFETLEKLILTANEQSINQPDGKLPDILIYPFAPWDGVIYDKEKDSARASTFNKDVFAVSFETFGEWQKTYVASTTVFATWATTFRDDKFYNEITYWKNGQLLGVHQKEHLFPFLDYTPKFAQSRGLYTTAVDGTPGTTTLQEKINGIQVGALVCSEVTHPISDSTSHNSDLVLSIGSEAFFSSGIAGDLNVANAAYRAAESGIPIIRANRFGPSAFIDQTGKTIAYMPFGVTGVLVNTIQVPILKK